jgi:hypothetical protein
MTQHNQDKGHYAHRALRGIGGNVENLRYALKLRDDAIESRDYDREQRANELYDHLRTLSREQLARRAGWDGPRQQVIATIIREEIT